MDRCWLAGFVSKHASGHTVEYTGGTFGHRHSVLPQLLACSTGFNYDNDDLGIIKKCSEGTQFVLAPTKLIDHRCRQQSIIAFQKLTANYSTYHGLKIAHNRGERVRADNGADGKKVVVWMLSIDRECGINRLF